MKRTGIAASRMAKGDLLDHLQIGIYRSNPGLKAKLVYVNPFLREMLGLSVKETASLAAEHIFTPPSAFRLLYKRLSREGCVKNFEVRLKGKNKKNLWCSFDAVAVKDQKGKVLYIDGVLQDISWRKQFEQGLIESKELFQTIFHNTAAAIIVTDQKQQIVAWNSFTQKIFDMNQEDLFNKPLKELFPLDEWQHITSFGLNRRGWEREDSRRTSLKMFVGNAQTKMIMKNGDLIDVDLSMNLLRNSNNKIIGTVGIMQDITKQKRFQEMLIQAKLAAEEANNAKSLFLANMSHEVRTPLNTIRGMIDLALGENVLEDKKKNLSAAKEASDQLLNLLNDILDLSTVEAGKLNIHYSEFHLSNVVRNLCKGLAILAGEKKLALITSLAPEIPHLVIGDPLRLRQVLTNLINNAIKFTEKGKIRLNVKIAEEASGWISLLFSIQDEGIGIAPDKQAKIFDVFTQADSSIAPRFGGTGLGLAISKRLVELMGGKIWVESQEGQGSTFYFTAAFKKIKVGKNEQPAIGPIRNLKNLRVLLAEDNVVNQKMTAQLLEKNGWSVKCVENGQQVLECLKERIFDVVLMDVQMPQLDGFKTTALIREQEKTTGGHIPIIALTAAVLEEDQQKCLEAGMDGYIPKPVEFNRLYEMIEDAFKNTR